MAAAVTGAASPILLHLLYHSPFGSHSTHHHQHFQPQSHMLPGSPYRSPQQQQRSGSSLTSPSRAVATLLHGISPSNRQRPATSSQAFVEAALSMSNDAIEWDDDVHYGVAGLDLDLDVGLGLDMDLMNTSLNASQGLDVSLGDIDLLQASTTAHVPVPVPQPSTVIHVPHQREEQLQAALHAALELSQAAETAMREMAAQLAMSKEQVALYQSSIQSIRALQTEQARKADEDLEQAELEIAVLKAAIGEAGQREQQMIGQHEQEIALQKAKAQQNQTLLQLAEQTIGQHEQEMTAQAQQQQTLRQTILQAEQTIAQRENELTAQAQQILVLKQTVGQPEQEIALLKAKAQQADLENQTLRTKTQQADQANKALKQTIDQLEQEIARLKSNAQHAVQVQTLPHQQGRTNEFSDMEAQLQEALTIASELSVKLTEREDEQQGKLGKLERLHEATLKEHAEKLQKLETLRRSELQVASDHVRSVYLKREQDLVQQFVREKGVYQAEMKQAYSQEKQTALARLRQELSSSDHEACRQENLRIITDYEEMLLQVRQDCMNTLRRMKTDALTYTHQQGAPNNRPSMASTNRDLWKRLDAISDTPMPSLNNSFIHQ